MSTIERERVEAPAVVTPREVLHRAADLLEEQGWTRGSEGLPHRDWHRGRRPCVPLCYLGSVAQAALDFGMERTDAFYLWAADMAGERSYVEAFRWNDAYGRTRADVVARLREAAEASA